MPDRLSPLDASFLRLEEAGTPLHVGSVMIFAEPEDGIDHDRLVGLVGGRIGELSRYRQIAREMPGRLGPPVWVDDEAFDLAYHVRRSALPRPGNMEQLEEFVARVISRPLDRARPLWEMYLVEGLEHDRFAVVTKTHEALVDGVEAVDLGHLLLDEEPEPEPVAAADWAPRRAPGDLELLLGGLTGALRRPARLGDLLRTGTAQLRGSAARVAEQAGRTAFALARTAARPAPASPLNTLVGGSRRVRMLRTALADYRLVREGADGDVSVHDVVLAAIAGGLRSWLQSRGEPVHSGSSVRALVPVGVGTEYARVGVVDEVVGCLVDLPVGEPVARLRLERIAYQMRRQSAQGQALAASSLSGLAGFAPPTLHQLGARAAGAMSRRYANLVVTNVPGPQQPLYAAGARMVATYPVLPLVQGQALSIGVTSYDGSVFIGLDADRRALPDLGLLADGIVEALAELVDDDLGPDPRSGDPSDDSIDDPIDDPPPRSPRP